MNYWNVFWRISKSFVPDLPAEATIIGSTGEKATDLSRPCLAA